MNKLALLFILLISALPAQAHEGTNAEHLILGLDTGIVVGIACGFAAGVASTLIYLKQSRRN